MEINDAYRTAVSYIQNFDVGGDPTGLINSYQIIVALFYQVSPEIIADTVVSLTSKVCDVLSPNLVEYAKFGEVEEENIETEAVTALLNLFIFFIYNISQTLDRCKERKVNFNPIYDRFLKLFIESRIDGLICKGITSKGRAVVFGGEYLKYVPSASYFLAIANAAKHLVEFHEENFNKLSLCLRELIYIANASSLQHEVDVKTDIQVLLQQNKNLGFSILQAFSFIDEVSIIANEENEELFKLNSVIESLERLLFVQNYIDETRFVLKEHAFGASEYLFPRDYAAIILRIQLGQTLEDILDDIKRYIADWMNSSQLSGDEAIFALLAKEHDLPSEALKMFMMVQQRCKPTRIPETVHKLRLMATQNQEMALVISEALGKCTFIDIETAELDSLASKLSFTIARGGSPEECVQEHFDTGTLLYQDVRLLRCIKDLDLQLLSNRQAHYIMEPTDENYQLMIEAQATKELKVVYESLSDHSKFLREFSEFPTISVLNELENSFESENRDEVRALKEIFKKTNDISYVLGIIRENPAHLADVTMVEELSAEQILDFLQIAKKMQETELRAAEVKLHEFEREQQEGITIDKGSDARQIKLDLQQKIQQTIHEITLLKKGNCAYFEEGIYWGITELLQQTRLTRHHQILDYLKSVGFIE